MEKEIRRLTIEDEPLLEGMQTGIENDYVIRVFERLVSGQNALYGLFADGQLASLAGYTLFVERYAMIGRLRSDIRFRGQNLSSDLTAFVRDRAFELPQVDWVGANTQEKNAPARRVLQKQGFEEQAMLHGAVAKDVSSLTKGGSAWTKTDDLERKRYWTDRMYVQTGAVFPYECYYNFPATAALFRDEELAEWDLYENADRSRMLIAKKNVKKYTNWHIVYPWHDFMEQPGFWETIQQSYEEMPREEEEETQIWLDFDKQDAKSLPADHPFDLPSPWVLYGQFRSAPNAAGSPPSVAASNRL